MMGLRPDLIGEVPEDLDHTLADEIVHDLTHADLANWSHLTHRRIKQRRCKAAAARRNDKQRDERASPTDRRQ
jgi:hypothetical protein